MIDVCKRHYETIGNWLINSGLFYLGWIFVIKDVLNGYYFWGILLTFLIILLHLWRSPRRTFEATLIVTMMLLGPLLDTILILSGVLTYQGMLSCCPWMAPPWIATLWGLFATSINHSLAWVGRSLWLTVATGAIGGTVSYYAAIKAGAAHFLIDEPMGIGAIALAWAIAMPACYGYNRWLSARF